MGKWNGNYVENPEAYQRAISARIKFNASTTRRRKLLAEIEKDGEDFRCWLLGETTQALTDLAAKSQAEYDASDEGGPAYRAYHKAWKEWQAKYGFVPDFLRTALEQWGGLTDKQLAFARKIFAERAGKAVQRDEAEEQRKATAPAWTEGRHEVEGVVASVKWADAGGPSWQSRGSFKGLVRLDDGRLLWTSIPSSLFYDANGNVELKGKRIAFKVTVTPKAEDPTFGFGKRPSNAGVVA
jgi:hypothetical protein